ncbi:MAG: hypothetical protein AAGE52_08915 [Myxococcota bacterium]
MQSNRDISRWVRPTLLGPFLTCWGIVTMAAMTQSLDSLRALFDVESWALAMLLISFFASAVAVCLVAVDVTLLRFKTRKLPSGAKGWVGAMLAPVATTILLMFLPSSDEIVPQVLRFAGALWIGALGVRLLLGTRP